MLHVHEKSKQSCFQYCFPSGLPFSYFQTLTDHLKACCNILVWATSMTGMISAKGKEFWTPLSCYLGYANCCGTCCCCCCSCCSCSICCWSCCCVICRCCCALPPPRSIVKQMQLIELHSGMAQLQAQLQSPNWKTANELVNKWLTTAKKNNCKLTDRVTWLQLVSFSNSIKLVSVVLITYRTLWSIAVLTHGSTWLSIHTTTECIITPLG